MCIRDSGASIEEGGEQGDADGAAEVAQDVEQARGRAGILRQDVGGGDQRHGDHHQRLAKRADDLDVLKLFAGEVRVEHPGEEARRAEQGETQGAQLSLIHIFPVMNAAALADAIQSLVESPALRQKMGVAGRAFAESEFSIQNVISQHLDIYHESEIVQ